jgi:hypothetical protein
MKLTVIGLSVIAFGTYLTYLGDQRVIGIVIIAIGSLVVAHAQRRESREDSERVEQKLSEIRREIAEAKTIATSPNEVKLLDNIGEEFRSWAAAFEKNKERGQLEIEQNRVGELKSQLDRSEIWRPVLELVIGTLRRSIEAYARETGLPLSADFSPLPMNLFDTHVEYRGTIVFTKELKWLVQLDSTTMRELSEFPLLWISRAGDWEPQLVHVSSLNRKEKFVQIIVHRDERLPRISGMSGTFSVDNYQDGVKMTIRRIVEAQLLSL